MTSPDKSSTVCLSLGSNIAPEQNLKKAVALLRLHGPVLALSSVYRTPPQGFTGQADFLNMAVRLTTTLSPAEFKAQIIGDIERRLGRVRDPRNKNAPRTIDLDIALWNHDVFDYGDKPWHIPDPDILRFAHVAVPLAEIAPDEVHPETGQTLARIAAQLDTSGMQRQLLDFRDYFYIVNVEGAIWRDGRYLMIVRGAEEDHAAGALAFVGGKVEGIDWQASQILEETLKREIREEVGLEVEYISYVLSQMFTGSDLEPVINMVFLCRYAGGQITISSPGEVASAEWLTPDEIISHRATPPWISDYLDSVEQTRTRLGW